MIHTKIIPKDTLVNISFYVPIDYIGEELDVIAFKKEEGFQSKEKSTIKTNNAARFKGLLTNTEAEKYHQYLSQVRTEWERDI